MTLANKYELVIGLTANNDSNMGKYKEVGWGILVTQWTKVLTMKTQCPNFEPHWPTGGKKSAAAFLRKTGVERERANKLTNLSYQGL